MGVRQIFVRFFGCNLACKFCDTPLYAFREYTPEELLERLKGHPGKFHSVSFTGGEPLLQKGFLKNIFALNHKRGSKNYLETNGTLPSALKEVIEGADIIAMDLKFPSSTGLKDYWGEHHAFLKIASQKDVFLKAVICKNTEEYDLKRALALIKDINEDIPLILQPDGECDYALLEEKLERFRDICLSEKIKARLVPQMHKILGVG